MWLVDIDSGIMVGEILKAYWVHKGRLNLNLPSPFGTAILGLEIHILDKKIKLKYELSLWF